MTTHEPEPFDDMPDSTLLAYWRILQFFKITNNKTNAQQRQYNKHEEFIQHQITKRGLEHRKTNKAHYNV